MKKLSCVVVLLVVLCFSSSGLAEGGQPFTTDFPSLKRELDGFKEVIQNTLLRNLLGPLPVLSMLGTYLPTTELYSMLRETFTKFGRYRLSVRHRGHRRNSMTPTMPCSSAWNPCAPRCFRPWGTMDLSWSI